MVSLAGVDISKELLACNTMLRTANEVESTELVRLLHVPTGQMIRFLSQGPDSPLKAPIRPSTEAKLVYMKKV